MPVLADLLIHPVRLRILHTLVGQELTTAELRGHLPDVPQATVYRHLDTLLDGGVLEVVNERPVRGAVERTFGLVEGRTTVGPEKLSGATRQQHATWFATFVAGLLNQFNRYLDTSQEEDPDASLTHDLAADAVSYRLVPLWMDDDEAQALLEDLRAVLQPRLTLQPGGERRRRMVSIISMPDA